MDTVAVALHDLSAGTRIAVPGGEALLLRDDIPAGHKIALRDIAAEAVVIKYGSPIGQAVSPIYAGNHVHSHNLKTLLSGSGKYQYQPEKKQLSCGITCPETIQAYKRKSGKIGIRNELWLIPTVGCVNGIAEEIIQRFKEVLGFNDACEDTAFDGVFTFPHPYGCSQLGDDHVRTRTVLQGMAKHPNAGGVLVLGLGCENNQIDEFKQTLGVYDEERVFFMAAQDVDDEVERGIELLKKLYERMCGDQREPVNIGELNIGLECGGSDAFSGITANPLIGKISDSLISRGASAVLTEVPEMFGAEHILMKQSADKQVFDKTVKLINDFKTYFTAHNQPVYENPSPGNRAGGITTLEDKSLGCTKKAGNSPVKDVLAMGECISKRGLNLLDSPGNDIVATTALGLSGCHIVLFSTGRGTPLGGFIPVIKISSRTELAERKPKWIDFDAGVLAKGEMTMDEAAGEFLKLIITIVEGKHSVSEKRSYRNIAIFKTGITL
ncbi:MAG: altronate dehydratase family protein [Spirochaetia bacterium]|nr:altronate dehydratase family protein [Spirochaetia bacterium]